MSEPRFYARDLAMMSAFAWVLGVITGVALFRIFVLVS
jgi:hypothetical protein